LPLVLSRASLRKIVVLACGDAVPGGSVRLLSIVPPSSDVPGVVGVASPKGASPPPQPAKIVQSVSPAA
jgi:hypothetical protein